MGSSRFETQLIDSLDEAIIAVDLQQRITHWNAAATRLLGWTLEEVVGLDLLLVLSDPRASGGLATSWEISQGIRPQVEAGQTWRGLLRVPNRAGRRMMLRATVGAVRGPDGLLGYVLSCQDVRQARRLSREQRRLEELEIDRRLRESEERFRALVELRQVGVFLLQDERVVYASPRLADMLGYQQADLMTLSDITKPVVGADPRELMKIYERRLNGEALPPSRLRVQHPQAGERIVELEAALTSYNGRPALVGTMLDITRSVQADAALRESEATHRQLIEALQEGVLLCKRDSRSCTYNQAAARLFGLPGQGPAQLDEAAAEILGTDGQPLPLEEWPILVTLRTGQALSGASMGVRQRKAEAGSDVIWLSVNTRPLWRPGEDKPYAAVASMTDVTERRRIEAELQLRAFYDPLTGLPNRVLFFERAERALAQARRSGELVAIGFVDLDTFKHVNDVFGHAAGDHLLQQVAQRLSRGLREGDTVARLGGDEFALLLPGQVDGEAAVRVAERVLEVLRQPLEIDGRTLSPTASLGLSLFPEDGAEVTELLRKADIAMYQAKAAGRDRFVMTSPRPTDPTLPRPSPVSSRISGRIARRSPE
jgi:diguanylate cyclase (GGDEF)-like protein/PAS domain S-box-containing protein